MRIQRIDGKIEKILTVVVNSGFSGEQPELLLPENVVRELKLREVSEPTLARKRTADGRIVTFICYKQSVKACVVTKDRVSSEIMANVLVGGTTALMNDYLISKFGIIILDAKNGIWCFRDELGKIERRGE